MAAPAADVSLARGAAITTVATAVSRVTGFVRVVVVAGAMGTTFLANTYQTANTAPNVVFELVAAGVLTSIFVPTFVEYLVKGQEEEGWRAANALASVALVGLVALSLIVALLADPIMRLLTLGVEGDRLRAREVALGATFLRLFAPQIAFYGIGMIMTGALHAFRRFALPAVAPIFNNVVVIGVYVTYAFMRGDRPPTTRTITDAETWVLGAGTTLGVIAMTLCLVPQLAKLGWRFRFDFRPSHPAVRKGARLGVWALGYAGGYQAGLIVVLMLANRIQGGVAAYQWAYTFFYLPHALFGVPIFNVLFTAMSEHVAKREIGELAGRLRDGLAMLGFILLPVGATLVAVGEPLADVTLRYGVMTDAGADLVSRVIRMFAIGLPTYSCFLVFTRAFYALGDTKTPALVNAATVAAASTLGALFFFVLPEGWEVAGLALGHSAGFLFGTVVLGRRLSRRVGSLGGAELRRPLARATVLSAVAFAVMWGVETALPDGSNPVELLSLVITALAGGIVYIAGMALAKSPELARVRSLARKR
ncbi:MAG: murein biosynthesis integral membrane protein MurJ [Actinomycetota bacterium]